MRVQKLLWWISGWLPVGIITYRQARHLAEDLHEWREIAIGSPEDRRESIVYGNCARTIEGVLGRKRVLRWEKKYGDKKF